MEGVHHGVPISTLLEVTNCIDFVPRDAETKPTVESLRVRLAAKAASSSRLELVFKYVQVSPYCSPQKCLHLLPKASTLRTERLKSSMLPTKNRSGQFSYYLLLVSSCMSDAGSGNIVPVLSCGNVPQPTKQDTIRRETCRHHTMESTYYIGVLLDGTVDWQSFSRLATRQQMPVAFFKLAPYLVAGEGESLVWAAVIWKGGA
eukprot:6253158-Amphidinium_carterae.1